MTYDQTILAQSENCHAGAYGTGISVSVEKVIRVSPIIPSVQSLLKLLGKSLCQLLPHGGTKSPTSLDVFPQNHKFFRGKLAGNRQ